MPFNGSGTFVRTFDWVQDKDNGIKIRADRHDDEMDDYATGLSNCITRDGQGRPTQNISWNSYKITNLANATSSGDAIHYGQLSDIPVTATNGNSAIALKDRFAEIVSVADYGATGDGTDETTEIQAAATALRTLSGGKPGILLFPNVGGTYGVTAPILIPQNCTVLGYASGRDGSPRTIIKALSGFTSSYTMAHKVSGSTTTYNVAAVLLSYEWTQNTLFCRGFDVAGLSIDCDYQTDNRGAPIHGAMNYGGHVNWGGETVIIGQTLGFGLWHNSLTPNGKWGGSDIPSARATAVACKYNNLRVKNSGGQVVASVDTPTYYTTNGGSYPYAAIQIGGLLDARDDGTNSSEPSLVTDGTIRSVEIISKCYGHGLVITRAGGWTVDELHTNNVGFDGIRCDSGSVFRILNCYIDGYGCHIPASYGVVYGINLVGIVGQSTTLNPSPVKLLNCIVRMRPVNNTSGNDFVAYRMASGSTAGETAAILFMGNSAATRNDIGSQTQYFYRITSGGTDFKVSTIANDVFEDAYLAGVQYSTWGSGTIREEIEGNSWQYRDAIPAAGFYMTGAKIWNKTPGRGESAGWVCITQGSPGTWVPFGVLPLRQTGTFNPGNIVDGSRETTTLSVTGAIAGDYVQVSFTQDLQGIQIFGYVSAADTVTIVFSNETGGDINLASSSLQCIVHPRTLFANA